LKQQKLASRERPTDQNGNSARNNPTLGNLETEAKGQREAERGVAGSHAVRKKRKKKRGAAHHETAAPCLKKEGKVENRLRGIEEQEVKGGAGTGL